MVADKLQALGLEPVFPQRDEQIRQPLGLVHQKKASAKPQAPRRAGAEARQRAAKLASGDGKRRIVRNRPAFDRVVRRIGENCVKAVCGQQRPVLPQIAMQNRKAGKAI